jgi:hypothetical protein
MKVDIAGGLQATRELKETAWACKIQKTVSEFKGVFSSATRLRIWYDHACSDFDGGPSLTGTGHGIPWLCLPVSTPRWLDLVVASLYPYLRARWAQGFLQYCSDSKKCQIALELSITVL